MLCSFFCAGYMKFIVLRSLNRILWTLNSVIGIFLQLTDYVPYAYFLKEKSDYDEENKFIV